MISMHDNDTIGATPNVALLALECLTTPQLSFRKLYTGTRDLVNIDEILH